jgi:hypothetical protein
VLGTFRLPDGKVAIWPLPCKRKACPTCGPCQRARTAAQWAHAMGGDVVYRRVVDDQEWPKLRRTTAFRGQEVAHLPAPNGERVVYTTAPVGEQVTDLIGSLASDFAAMPNDDRRARVLGNWRQVVDDLQAEALQQREARQQQQGWQYLGTVGRSVEHLEVIARRLGIVVLRTSAMLIVTPPDDPETWRRFCALARLRRGRYRPKARAA